MFVAENSECRLKRKSEYTFVTWVTIFIVV